MRWQATFEEALQSHGELSSTWEAYASFLRQECLRCAEGPTEESQREGAEIGTKLLDVYQQAQARLGEECPGALLLAYCNDLLLFGRVEEATTVADAALERTTEPQMAGLRLSLATKQAVLADGAVPGASARQVKATFDRCLASCTRAGGDDEPEEVAELWYTLLEYLVVSGGGVDEVEKHFMKAILRGGAVAAQLQVRHFSFNEPSEAPRSVVTAAPWCCRLRCCGGCTQPKAPGRPGSSTPASLTAGWRQTPLLRRASSWSR